MVIFLQCICEILQLLLRLDIGFADENNDELVEEDDEESDGDGDEGEGDKDEEEEGDLEDAWKMLEFARVIHEKHGLCTIETVDIITKLADVNCFKGWSIECDLFRYFLGALAIPLQQLTLWTIKAPFLRHLTIANTCRLF